MTFFHVCHGCACAIMNCDDSAMDERTSALFAAFCESAGLLCDAGLTPFGGYWTCDCCGEVEIGDAHALSRI